MEYMGIKIYAEPRHGSVKRVQKLKNQWYVKNLPLTQLDQSMSIADAIQKSMSDNLELLIEFQDFLETADDYQNIMLATTLTYDDILQLEDKFTTKEFQELIEVCKKATGGVGDFFGESSSDTNSKTPAPEQMNPDCTSSPDQHGGSTLGSITPTMENNVS
ncbi:hypothetical protein V7O66_13730 [Methanolobus sp. ZRKC3]|uniref:hypothetical protein n=1 Tax=Methanolobus sp. ZRKC3 TaxID=3125786 RepID=UPI0032524913